MVTLRAFDSPLEAGLAKSLPRDRGIESAVRRYPREYWWHEWLANVEFEANNLQGAEIEYQPAYELLAKQEISKRLQDIRIRMASQPSPSPTPSPWRAQIVHN